MLQRYNRRLQQLLNMQSQPSDAHHTALLSVIQARVSNASHCRSLVISTCKIMIGYNVDASCHAVDSHLYAKWVCRGTSIIYFQGRPRQKVLLALSDQGLGPALSQCPDLDGI